MDAPALLARPSLDSGLGPNSESQRPDCNSMPALEGSPICNRPTPIPGLHRNPGQPGDPMTPDNRSRIELIAAHYGRRVNARGVLAMPCVVHQGTNPKLELRPGDDDRIRATCYSQGCSYPETARVIEEQTGVRFNPSITGSTALPSDEVLNDPLAHAGHLVQ